MTDYTKSTGSSGTMMIRDTGGKVQFWIKAGSGTFAYQMPWGFTVNGTTDNSNEFRFESGGNWQMIRQWTVSSSQTVTFRLYDTGTSGLGGPTTFPHEINRDTVPDEPSACRASLITATTAFIQFTDPADNGGDAINSRQIAYRLPAAPSGTETVVSSDGSTTLSGLSPGTSYYVWARVHNSIGYSTYGPRITIKTLDNPDAPGVVSFSEIEQTSVKVTFVDGDTGGTGVIQRQVGYSTSTWVSIPTTIVIYNGKTLVPNLQPATKYYFRSRTINSVGSSSWGPVSTVTTLAGVRINVNGVWKNGIPYVRVSGVWKVGRPWIRLFGYWEDSA